MEKIFDMRTTIDLPDDLVLQVKEWAERDGLRFEDLITRFVEQGLRQGPLPSGARTKRSELPVTREATGRPLPSLTNVDVSNLLDEDDAI
jgi:hypothetical protein